MPFAVIEREIQKLDAEQQNSVVMFVRFLLSQKAAATPLAEPRAKALHRVADENAPQWLNEISGIASLPCGKRDSDLVYDAIVEKPGFVNVAIPVMSPAELLRSI